MQVESSVASLASSPGFELKERFSYGASDSECSFPTLLPGGLARSRSRLLRWPPLRRWMVLRSSLRTQCSAVPGEHVAFVRYTGPKGHRWKGFRDHLFAGSYRRWRDGRDPRVLRRRGDAGTVGAGWVTQTGPTLAQGRRHGFGDGLCGQWNGWRSASRDRDPQRRRAPCRKRYARPSSLVTKRYPNQAVSQNGGPGVWLQSRGLAGSVEHSPMTEDQESFIARPGTDRLPRWNSVAGLVSATVERMGALFRRSAAHKADRQAGFARRIAANSDELDWPIAADTGDDRVIGNGLSKLVAIRDIDGEC